MAPEAVSGSVQSGDVFMEVSTHAESPQLLRYAGWNSTSLPLPWRGKQRHGVPLPTRACDSSPDEGRLLGAGSTFLLPLHRFASLFPLQHRRCFLLSQSQTRNVRKDSASLNPFLVRGKINGTVKETNNKNTTPNALTILPPFPSLIDHRSIILLAKNVVFVKWIKSHRVFPE